MQLLYAVGWFLLPAGCANMAPLFAARIAPRWTAPIDGGRTFRGVRIFGDHKTVRGMVAGVLVAAAVFAVQRFVAARSDAIRAISVVDYETNSIWFGAWQGFGALGGDLIKSFFKRRVGRAPGKSWFPFDQIDWMVGSLAATYPLVRPGLAFVGVALLVSLALSLIVKAVGFVLHVDDRPI